MNAIWSWKVRKGIMIVSEDEREHHSALYIDLELSCWAGAPPRGMRQEIIEIGVVELDLATLEITRGKFTLCTAEKLGD
jgi:hypothetical protein